MTGGAGPEIQQGDVSTVTSYSYQGSTGGHGVSVQSLPHHKQLHGLTGTVGVPDLDDAVLAGADEDPAVLAPAEAGEAVLVTVPVTPADVESQLATTDIVNVETAVTSSGSKVATLLGVQVEASKRGGVVADVQTVVTGETQP